MLTPEQRSARARKAAYASHARHDPAPRIAWAQAHSPTHLPYWERKVRAEHPELPDDDVTQQARALHLAYWEGLRGRRKTPTT